MGTGRLAIWSLARFRRAAVAMLGEIPAPLLSGLTGGVLVMPQARRRRGDPPGVYVLGEYLVNQGVGRMIVIYYGSFRRTLAGATWARVKEELRRTIRHELRHHAEHLAGLADLELEDKLRLEQWSRRRGGADSDKGKGDRRDG